MLGPYLGAVPGAALLLFSGQPCMRWNFWSLFWWCSRWTETLLRRAFWAAPRAFPAWVLAAIVVGGGLFGIPGMVIGVPVLGVAANPCQSGPAQGTGWGKNKTGRGN